MKTLKIVSIIAVIFAVSAFTIQPLNQGYKIGDIVKDFQLKNVNTKQVALSDYNDEKGVIVVFTCNSCPYAKMYEQRIMDLDKLYAEQGFPVLAIMPNDTELRFEDSFKNMQKRAREMKYTFRYVIDEDQTVYPQFGATKTPHIYLLKNTEKGFQVAYIGAIDDNPRDANAVTEKYVENAVNALLNGKDIEVTETKAIGCSIKAK